MKTAILLSVLAAILFPSFAPAESGCPKGQDACAGPVKAGSGFLGEVEAAQRAPRPAAAKQTAVPVRPPEASVAVSSAPVPARESGLPPRGGFSRPAWLLLAGGGIAALYVYLREGKRRGKKK